MNAVIYLDNKHPYTHNVYIHMLIFIFNLNPEQGLQIALRIL